MAAEPSSPRVSDVRDKKRILFVDDEPGVLDGLRRALHPMREEWDLSFASSGAEALDRLDSQPADLVVSDLRMPHMDGAELLGAIQRRQPGIIRFVLSGYADRFMILRCAGPAHRFLIKPCPPEHLVQAIRRAFSLRDLLHSHALLRLMEGAANLPALPGIYATLMAALQSPDSNLREIASILSRNAAMADTMLRLVNSAYVMYLESIQQAVAYLGAEAISAVALTSALFDLSHAAPDPRFDVQAAYEHSLAVGATAGPWIAKTTHDRKLAEEATMAGMTHDIGKLVFLRNQPDAWFEALHLAEQRNLPPHAAEREIFGVTHAEVGAYLLNQWGVADDIVEAVAYHHHPAQCLVRERNSLFAVHAANALCHKWHSPSRNWRILLDAAYLASVDPQWNIETFESAIGRT